MLLLIFQLTLGALYIPCANITDNMHRRHLYYKIKSMGYYNIRPAMLFTLISLKSRIASGRAQIKICKITPHPWVGVFPCYHIDSFYCICEQNIVNMRNSAEKTFK